VELPPSGGADELQRAPGPEPTSDLDDEAKTRLRARYTHVLSLIAARIADPRQRERLNALAERLNPDSWTGPAAVRRGLEDYESVVASLGAVLGHRRRRRKPRGGTARPSGSEAPERAQQEGQEEGQDGEEDPGPDVRS
jgi:hypothetical protein